MNDLTNPGKSIVERHSAPSEPSGTPHGVRQVGGGSGVPFPETVSSPPRSRAQVRPPRPRPCRGNRLPGRVRQAVRGGGPERYQVGWQKTRSRRCENCRQKAERNVPIPPTEQQVVAQIVPLQNDGLETKESSRQKTRPCVHLWVQAESPEVQAWARVMVGTGMPESQNQSPPKSNECTVFFQVLRGETEWSPEM